MSPLSLKWSVIRLFVKQPEAKSLSSKIFKSKNLGQFVIFGSNVFACDLNSYIGPTRCLTHSFIEFLGGG